MKIGPKYKIARRLGAPVFDKTQTQKFKASSDRRSKSRGRSRGANTNYSVQLTEKQKARYTYGVSEKQFSKYVKEIINKKSTNPQEQLFKDLETRLDNVIYRIGLGNTRGFTRQLVSHGHIKINGRKVNIPSYKVKKGDAIDVKEGSLKKPVFQDLEEKLKDRELPVWINKEKTGPWKIVDLPAEPKDLMFDLNAVIQFYKR